MGLMQHILKEGVGLCDHVAGTVERGVAKDFVQQLIQGPIHKRACK